MTKMLATLGLAASALLLAGCYESPEVTLHEPQQYLGEKDPLMGDAAARQEQLRKRFEMVQIDR